MDKTIRTIIMVKDASMEKMLVELFYYWPIVGLKMEVVGIARNGAEALDLVKKEVPDLVVIGWDMADEMKLVEKCHKDEYYSRFIILVHQECPELEKVAAEFGASVVMSKDPNMLMKRIEELFQ